MMRDQASLTNSMSQDCVAVLTSMMPSEKQSMALSSPLVCACILSVSACCMRRAQTRSALLTQVSHSKSPLSTQRALTPCLANQPHGVEQSRKPQANTGPDFS